MEIFYDRHDKNYQDCINNEKDSKKADAWLNLDSLDYWRHKRMLKLLKPFIKKSDKWLTIGDGRYGSEAAWLKRNGVECHATDMHTDLLEMAFKKGIIDSFSKQNAEKLGFKSNSFDYVLIKETLHHLPRPWLAIYEAFRVCKYGVIIIEPNDCYHYGSPQKLIFSKFKNLAKKITNRNFFKEEFNFEEVGNFIYTINIRELEKFLLGMHKTSIAVNNINDHYLKDVEYIPFNSKSLKDKIVFLKLKTFIFMKDFLCNLGFLSYSLKEVILFKKAPNNKEINHFRAYNWEYKKLPDNPYL